MLTVWGEIRRSRRNERRPRPTNSIGGTCKPAISLDRSSCFYGQGLFRFKGTQSARFILQGRDQSAAYRVSNEPDRR
jgi:hypothetical protein